jgi:tetratricopeptide (TPR) repeat protein
MYNRSNSIALLMSCCLALAACGSAPEKPNLRTEQASRLSARADAAFLQGEYGRAKDDYLQALRINQSVENVPEIAIARFNLARVFRELARSDQAHLHLDALFSEPALPYPADTLAAAAALKGQLHLEGSQPTLALPWIEKGEGYCRKSCAVAGSLLLLRAQVAQRDGKLDEALRFADNAVSALNSDTQQMELANAQRLSGEISMAKKDYARAIQSFQQAFAADQKLGVPAKIRLDLVRLGAAHEHSGAAKSALHYYARALAVSEGMGSAQAADEIRTYIRGLQGSSEAITPEPR